MMSLAQELGLAEIDFCEICDNAVPYIYADELQEFVCEICYTEYPEFF
jgi:hypothetical protein